jgi:hypothetical protein
MKKFEKTGKFRFVTGFVAGALIFGAVSAYAATTITASLSADKVYVNGKSKTVEAYQIDNEQYVKLTDISKALNVSVTYDSKNKRYNIDTTKNFAKSVKNTNSVKKAVTDGYGTVFNMYKTGDVIKTKANPDIPNSVGGDYKVKIGAEDKTWKTGDGKVWPNQPLPEWQSEWDNYPKVEMPEVLTSHFKGDVHGMGFDTVMITNQYEIERMIRTIYKYAKQNPSLWKDRDPSTNIPNFTIKAEFTDDMALHTFYPWREWAMESFVEHTGIGKEFKIYVYDTYNNGLFLDTEYFLR